MLVHATYTPTQTNMTGGSELFANQRIRLASAGALHLAVVAEDSAVYTCGYSANVRLGLGDEQRRRRLTRVRQAVIAGSRVMMVACSGHHTMAGDGGGTRRHCAYERERARESQ
jgi:alpha-tubulin suppressor-like RCC1 family protein